MSSRINNDIKSLVRLILTEDARGLVGDYLWPDGRWSQVKKGIKTNIEPDTPRESDLRTRIIGFIMNHKNKTIDQAAADDLLMIASDPNYKKTLPLYTKGPVYRGISVSDTWFKKNFGISYEEILEDKPPGDVDDVVHVFEGDRIIRPINTVSSWSKSMPPALDFAMGGGASGSDFSVPIVYESDPQGGNFIDLRAVYDIGGDIPYRGGEALWSRRNEDEVISIGPVRVSKIHVIGWRHRQPGKLRHTGRRLVGTGYDDVGKASPWGRNLLDVPLKYIDREFDMLNVPDIDE